MSKTMESAIKWMKQNKNVLSVSADAIKGMTKYEQGLRQNAADLKEEAQDLIDQGKQGEAKAKLEEAKAAKSQLEKYLASEGGSASGFGIMFQEKKENESNSVNGSNAYKDAFWGQMKNQPLDHEQRGVLEAPEVKGMAISTNQAGGHLVPETLEKSLIAKLAEVNVMRQISNVLPMAPGDRKIPIVADHGEAAWIPEGALYPESEVTFDAISLGGFKIARIVQVTEELMHDSVVSIEDVVVDSFVRSFGEAEEEAFIKGDGIDRPTGVLERAEVGVTGSSETEITSDEIYDIFYDLRRPYRSTASWLMNDQTVKIIRQLKTADGAYIWSPGFGTEPPTLLGRPVYTSPFMPTMAAGSKSILFGDFSYYKIADRQGRVMQRLNELYAANGRVGLRMFQRVDGNLALPEAIKSFQNKAGV